MAPKIKSLKPVYLIYGPEKLLLKEALERLKETLSSSSLAFNYEQFDGETATGSEIIQAAQTLPFASEKRLVVVKNAEKLKPTEQAIIAQYAKNPVETTCLVLVANKVNKDSPIFKAISEQKSAYEYKPPARSQYPQWIEKEFSRRGQKISPEAVKVLLERTGYNLWQLANEIEKVSLYCHNQKKIDLAEITSLVEKTSMSSIFDFLDACGSRNKERALSTFNQLWHELESGHIFGMLVRHFRLLLKAKVLLEKSVDDQTLIKVLGVKPYEANKCRSQSRNFSQTELKNAFKFFLEADLAIKSGQQEPKIALENLILDIL